MDATRTQNDTTDYRAIATANAITEFTRANNQYQAKRNLALRRGDWVSAGVLLAMAIAICEPNSNRVLKASPVGQFFTQVKLELPATKPQQQKVSGLVPPLPPDKAVITSRYGERIHPVDGVKSFHYGIDISQALGAEIVAIAPGKVIDVENRCRVGDKYCGGQFGNLVKIDHGNGFTSLYGHLTRARVKIGQTVRAGQVIGLEGTTGNSSGTHLHLQLEQDGKPFDPEQKFPNTWKRYKSN